MTDAQQEYKVTVEIRGATYTDIFLDYESAKQWADDLWVVYEGNFSNGDRKLVIPVIQNQEV